MEIKAIKCPSCGADLQVPDDKDFMVCPYCQTTVQVREDVKLKSAGDPANLIKLADEDLKAGNYKEAYDYYNKALETDAANPDAWLGKAVSSGFMSNNINQMMEWISVAVSDSYGDKQQSIKLKAASYINTIIIGYDSTIDQSSNLLSFLDLNTGSVEIYTSVINAMETAHNYSPANTEILHNLIKVCVHSKKYIHTAEIDTKINKYKDELKQLDPNYDPNQDSIQPPVISSQPQTQTQSSPTAATAQQKSSGCAKYVWITLIITFVTIVLVGVGIYFLVHSVSNTIDETKENITKQVEPLKELQKMKVDVPQHDIVKEFETDNFHVMNVCMEKTYIDKVVIVNNYLVNTYKNKYDELIINYFEDKNIASNYDDVISSPDGYKSSVENAPKEPNEIMIVSKTYRQSSLYRRAGSRYTKYVY